MAPKKQHKKANKSWIDLGVRGTLEENEIITAAANLRRQSRCQFILLASLEAAKRVKQEASLEESAA